MEKKLFEIATRKKYRWETEKGILSVEDLWDLKLEQLDKIAVSIYKQLKEAQEISFIKEVSSETEETQNKFNIIKYIIDTKIEEQRKAQDERIRREKKRRIMEIIKRKEEEELLSKSKDELNRLLEEL